MSTLSFSSPSFATPTKKGIMVPDETGYYGVSLGGLNIPNTKGEVYLAKNVLHLFNNTSLLVRRCNRGELKSELGHPYREGFMTETDFYNRALTVREDRVCSHIRKVDLDLEFGKKNPGKVPADAIGIYGLVIPAGPFADTVQRDFDNPYSQAAYSIRCVTDVDVINGIRYKTITMPITFDYVTSPGIHTAGKDNALSLESEFADDVVVDVELMKIALNDSRSILGLEHSEVEFREAMLEVISKTETIQRKGRRLFTF